jgi:hypothetical protein
MIRDSRRSNVLTKKHWYQADEGEVHKHVFDYVRAVENNQFKFFDRLQKLAFLYDPNNPSVNFVGPDGEDACSVVIENVVASNIDTLAANVASASIRARFMTDGADWSTQRKARHLEWYAEDISKKFERDIRARMAAKASYKKGTGLVKVYADAFDRPRLDHVLVDDFIVDENESRCGGMPRQFHHRMLNADRDELKAMFPDHEEAIEVAQTSRGWGKRWASYRPIVDGEIVIIESWRLPIGVKGHDLYKPGRHAITIDGCTLLDEEWDKPGVPFAVIFYNAREDGFYGISLAEGIAGIQRALNKRNWQIDRNIDQYAVPTTYATMADANLTVQTVNRIGTLVIHKGPKPQTEFPPSVPPEIFQNRQDLKASAYEGPGVSRMAAQAVKPAGIDSAVALREHKDQTSERHAPQEESFEKLVLDITMLLIEVCKELGEKAPKAVRQSKFGRRDIEWGDVDMGETRMQIVAASNLSRTPAGRTQFVIELAQGGIISQDSATRLLQHPDIERELSLYTSALESIEEDFEEIADGGIVVPEPFDNHEMIVWRGQRQYNQWRKEKAPESVLEAIRQYIVIGAWYITQKTADAANGNMQAGAAGAMPGAPGAPPSELPTNAPLPSGPAPTQPVAALSTQAMNLRSA